MSAIRPHTCGSPGPYGAHCTDDPGHRYACYDAGEDTSWVEGDDDLRHGVCADPNCEAQNVEPGDEIALERQVQSAQRFMIIDGRMAWSDRDAKPRRAAS